MNNGVRNRKTHEKMLLASNALMERLEQMERNHTSGRLILEVNINCGGIVNASISTQEPVFQNVKTKSGCNNYVKPDNS